MLVAGIGFLVPGWGLTPCFARALFPGWGLSFAARNSLAVRVAERTGLALVAMAARGDVFAWQLCLGRRNGVALAGILNGPCEILLVDFVSSQGYVSIDGVWKVSVVVRLRGVNGEHSVVVVSSFMSFEFSRSSKRTSANCPTPIGFRS